MANKTIYFTDDFLAWLKLTGNDEELSMYDLEGDLSDGLQYDPESESGDAVDTLLGIYAEDFGSEYEVNLRNSEEGHWH